MPQACWNKTFTIKPAAEELSELLMPGSASCGAVIHPKKTTQISTGVAASLHPQSQALHCCLPVGRHKEVKQPKASDSLIWSREKPWELEAMEALGGGLL